MLTQFPKMPLQKNILKAITISIGAHLIIILLLAKLIQTQRLLMKEEQPKILVSFQFLPKELRITARKRVKVRSPLLLNPRRNMAANTRFSTEREDTIEQPKIFPVLAKVAQTNPLLADLNTSDVALTDSLNSTIKLDGVFLPKSDYSRSAGDLLKDRRSFFRNKHTFVTKKLLPEAKSIDLFPIETSLVKIARNIVSHSKNIVDIVLLIDGSRSMRNDIESVQNHLRGMTDVLNLEHIDFTIGVIIFRHHRGYGLLGWDFEVTQQTKSISQITKVLEKVRCIGGEKAIDSIYRAAGEVKFRDGAERTFILVTDEYLAGNYKPVKVLERLRSKKISLSIIGRKEQAQKSLAHQTSGIWLPIDSLKF